MIHPSYQELMEKVNAINENIDSEDAAMISSRYSLVQAAAKRARQLTNGAEPKVAVKSDKQLSVAVEELYEGKVMILSAPAEEDNADAEAMAAAEEFEDLVEEEAQDDGIEDSALLGVDDEPEE